MYKSDVWIVLLALAPFVFCNQAIADGPSFDCNKVRLPAEISICGNPRLAALVNLIAAGYGFLKSTHGRPFADEIGIPFWRLRNSCSSDQSCIERTQIEGIKAYQAAGAPISLPEWVFQANPTQTQGLSSGVGVAAPPPPSQLVDYGPSTVIPMQKEGGTFVVPVSINGQLTLKFTIDSGASDVSIPADVVSTLIRTETITDSDFLGTQIYTLADGSTIPSPTFTIRSLKVGDKVLQNVQGSVASAKGSLLLGQSFLSRFKSWSIDNQRQVLLLN
jgi:clan AA aspartic protease (TIGR02281 family)